MKFLVVFALCLAAASAERIYQREVTLPAFGAPSPRIIGGKDAAPEQFPYQAGLNLHMNAVSRGWCGGSVISNTYVLTAAHCTNNVVGTDVYLGSVLYGKGTYTTYVTSSNIKVHESYMPSIIKNDISVIKIPSVAYTAAIKAVNLPANNNANYDGVIGVASGWGRTSDSSNSLPSVLKYADLQVVNNNVCAATYGSTVVSAGNICAETKNTKHSTCNGDSGGPLVIQGTYNQIGLTSYGASAGCDKGYPVAFTRVAYYLTWINANTK